MKRNRMGKKMRRLSALLLVIVVCLSVFTGCKGSGTKADGTGASVTGTTGTTIGAGASKETSVPEEATIKWFFKAGTCQLPDDGFIVKKIKQDLNINFRHIAPKTSEYNESLNLLLASGEVPDVISCDPMLMTRLISDGMGVPVEKYLTKEYVPNLIHISNKWDEVLSFDKYIDGHTYCIPNANRRLQSVSMYIRYDWLKNLNLQVPKDLNELKDVLTKFTKDDPDKNGKDDTVGVMIDETWTPRYYSAIMACNIDSWYKTETGQATLGCFLPAHKDFLKYMKSLIDTGALDKETLTTKDAKVQEQILAGKIGFAFNYNAVETCKEVKKAQPEAEWWPMPPVKGAYDKGYLPCGSYMASSQHLVTTHCKDLDALFRLVNYMCEDKGEGNGKYDFTSNYWYIKLGEKGLNWDVIDGKLETGDHNEKMNAQNTIDTWHATWFRFGNRFDNAFWDAMIGDEKKWLDEYRSYSLFADIPADDPKRVIAVEGVILPEDVAAFIIDNDIKWAEMYGKAILGREDIDKLWADFVAEAERRGLTQIQEKMTQLLKDNGRIK